MTRPAACLERAAATRAPATPGEASPARRPRALGELLLVAGLFLAYKAGRLLTAGNVGEAAAHASAVWHLERLLRLPSELAIQHTVLSQQWLTSAADNYYAYVHFPATIACLLWLYLRRPAFYRRTRQILAGLTATALLVQLAYPLAPPRLTPGTGLLDTGTLYGPAVYGPPATDTLSNQYAAMPSLHVGWAIVVAVALVAATRNRLRWLWLAHPVITLSVVVATGNHYWLDAAVAMALLVVVAALVLRAGAWRTALGRLRDTDRHRRPDTGGRQRPGTDGRRRRPILVGCAAALVALVLILRVVPGFN
jgi:hypothetical protein